jgi:hypothetical protein
MKNGKMQNFKFQVIIKLIGNTFKALWKHFWSTFYSRQAKEKIYPVIILKDEIKSIEPPAGKRKN